MENQNINLIKSQGIIIHGSNINKNTDFAYKTIIEYMNIIDKNLEKHLFANTYPNFLLIEKDEDKNEISIEESRKIIEFLSLKPSITGKRAVLIKSFENMSRNAANSLLKVLEEPPLDSIIILTTDKLYSILPTIRSRCIKIRIHFEDSEIINIDKTFIEKTIDFLSSNCKNSKDFAKENSEKFEDFMKISMFYISKKMNENPNLLNANKFLKLQDFYYLCKNTYPDKQMSILAATYILQN